jgi:hypothetical protein
MYTPYALLKNCRIELGKNGRSEFREQFHAWCVAAMPAAWGDELEDIQLLERAKREVAVMAGQNKTAAEIERYLREQGVQIQEGETADAAITRTKEQERKQLYVRSSEIYEDVERCVVKPAVITRMLVEKGLLVSRV